MRIILSVNLRPGQRSSKLNKCLRQEPVEGYKTVIAYSDDVSAVESWADGDGWACGSPGKSWQLPVSESAPSCVK